MKGYQIYFFFLKTIVLLQLVLTALGYELEGNTFFLIVDTLFKTSMGLFLGIYFWLFTPKGLDLEDGIIISIGGFLLLTEIRFKPLLRLYETRDTIAKITGSAVKNGTGISEK